eukprot:SAG22_NODE_9364_length_593_cov_0.862348_1_plen_65_part_10
MATDGRRAPLPPCNDYSTSFVPAARRADGGYELPVPACDRSQWRRLKLSKADGDVFMIEFVCDAN